MSRPPHPPHTGTSLHFIFPQWPNSLGWVGRADGQMIVSADASLDMASLGTGGFELVLSGAGEKGQGKILGSREFARYYCQKHKPSDVRQSVAVNRVVAKYALHPCLVLSVLVFLVGPRLCIWLFYPSKMLRIVANILCS